MISPSQPRGPTLSKYPTIPCSRLSVLRLYLGHAAAMFSTHSCLPWPWCDMQRQAVIGMMIPDACMHDTPLKLSPLRYSLSSLFAFFSTANLTFPRRVPNFPNASC
jgi:hypothetical protein